jgi:deoxyribodipyrimidine photolyase-like uncharacterized protein
MTPTQIIINDRTSLEDGYENVISALGQRLDEGNSLLIQKDNSLLFLTRLDEGVVEAHFYSTESAHKVVSAVQHFINEMVENGIKVMYIYDFGDDNMNRILQIIGLTVLPSDRDPYQFMVNLQGVM